MQATLFDADLVVVMHGFLCGFVVCSWNVGWLIIYYLIN